MKILNKDEIIKTKNKLKGKLKCKELNQNHIMLGKRFC